MWNSSRITFGLYVRPEPRKVNKSICPSSLGNSMRSLPILFAIAAVLLCPYNCAVRAAASRVGVNKVTAKTCCERCRAARPVEGDETPDQRAPREDSRSCFCTGVVFDASARAPADTLLFLMHWTLSVDSEVVLESTSPKQVAIEAAGPPPILGGRLLRIANGSFLI